VFPRKRRHRMGRKKHSKELKASIALDTIKGQKTMSELASEYGVHANHISRWKKQLLDAAPDVVTREKDKEAEKKKVERDRLYLGFRSLKNDIFIFFAVSLKPRLIKKLVTVQEV